VVVARSWGRAGGACDNLASVRRKCCEGSVTGASRGALAGCYVSPMTASSAADDEKLGPIGPLPSVWEHEARGIIIAAFRAATEDVAAAARLSATDLHTSVHEFRKALRRACALLALVRPALRKREYAAIRSELRTARRAASAARDQSVAADALAALALGPEEREIAEALVGVLRERGPVVADLTDHMSKSAERARAQADALDAALSSELEWDVIAEGLSHTYREARAARRGAKRSHSSFHRWRRRSKELDAQLTLVAAHGGERAEALHVAYEALSAQLGPIADLLMLGELIDAHGKASERGRFELLAKCIQRLSKERIQEARLLAKPLFAAPASRFAKQVTKAIRNDADPPAPRVEGDDPGDSED
jgi:CHAD domain-containing protein